MRSPILVALSCALLVVACQPVAPTVEPLKPITIGVSLPLTGDFKEPGTSALRGYQVWVELVNEAGGLLGREVVLKFTDNGSNKETAAADYERLITVDKVDLVVGTFSSLLVIPTSEVAARFGYAYVEPAGGSPAVFNRGLTNLFFAQPAPSARQADPFALYILRLPPDQRPRTFAIVALDDPFTKGVMERLRTLLTEGGLELAYETTYPEGTTDFSSIAAQVALLNPDLIVGGSQTVDCIGQIRAYQSAGYQPRLAYFTNGPTLPLTFKGELGSATEEIFSSISWYPDSREYQNEQFVTKYIEMFGGAIGDIPEDAANAFTVGQVLEQAIKKINSIDNAALIQELHRGRYQTIVGPLNFDETGAPQGSYMLLQWQGDNFMIVGPPDRAEVDPLPPPKPLW